MFPSMKQIGDIYMSTRNMPKDFIKPEDLVLTKLENDIVLYSGDKKPSVDAPIQLSLYSYYKNINYFIHGHANIKGFGSTKMYYPCGDMREIDEIIDVFPDKDTKLIILNLKNHGFLLGTEYYGNMDMLVDSLIFEYRNLGETL